MAERRFVAWGVKATIDSTIPRGLSAHIVLGDLTSVN